MASETTLGEQRAGTRLQALVGGKGTGRVGNRVFAGISTGAGVMILVALAAVAIFLIWQAWPAITAGSEQIIAEDGIIPKKGKTSFWDYVAPLVFGTVLSSALALLMAVPLSIGIALFISHYAPRRLAQSLGYLVDLLAAIPSVIYGMWGFSVLGQDFLDPLFKWISSTFSFIPFLAGYTGPATNIATVSLVLAVMVLPIITATIREVFLQTPKLHEEASLALGSTRWEMIRMAVLPFGRSGIISASMLGLGRAMGETMAVALILSPGMNINFDLLLSGQHGTIAANIASNYPESIGLDVNVLIATGLVLFAITLAVNLTARWIINRRAEFSGAN